MNAGRVSQTVLKRSVYKPLTYKRKEAVLQPSPQEMCGVIKTAGMDCTVTASCSLYGNNEKIGIYAMARVINDIASRGACPVGAGVQFLLPKNLPEIWLKTAVERMERAGCAHAVQILSADARVCPQIASAVVSVYGVGVQNKADRMEYDIKRPGLSIVLLKWIGLEGTLHLLDRKSEELRKRFVPAFLRWLDNGEPELFSERILKFAMENGAVFAQQITDGGIFAALWDIAELTGCGLTVDQNQMTVRQETVEVCEFFRLNPYQMTSTGSFLVLTEDGEGFVNAMKRLQIPASILGKTTKGREKIIMNGQDTRYLDRPAPDELVNIDDL